jgi:SAM-dependent methyltransferase
MPADLVALRERIRTSSPLSPEATESVLARRFDRVPRRLAFALARWPLARSAVLDVGCSYGHCLAHFGPGSLGVDNEAECVEFARAIGLEVVRLDVDDGLDTLSDRRFDFVWISDLLEHLDAPRLVLRDVRATLRPDGKVLVYVSTLPRSRLVRSLLRRLKLEPFAAEVHHYQFTRETATYLVERAGYRVESVEVPFLEPLGWLLGAQSPRLFLEAVPDAARGRVLERAESRIKPG